MYISAIFYYVLINNHIYLIIKSRFHIRRYLLQDIETGSFRDLPNLVTLILSHNKLSTINFHAFSSLTHLQKLELQYNALNDFSLSVCRNGKIFGALKII